MAKITTTQFGDLAFLPFPAKAPAREFLEYCTDSIISHNGTEERIKLRKKPRRSFEFDIPVSLEQLAEGFNTVYQAIREKWAIPVWTEGQYVGNLSAGSTFVRCNTTNADLKEDGLALVFSNCGHWEVKEITGVASNGVTFGSLSAAFKRAWLFPVQIGRIIGDVAHKTDGFNTLQTIKYFVEENEEEQVIELPTYKDEPIYFGTPMSSDTLRTIKKAEEVTDFELGKTASHSFLKNTQFAIPHPVILNGLGELRQFKRFLATVAGRAVRFWKPTFENNIRITSTGTLTNSLQVMKDSYKDWEERSNISLLTTDETWHSAKITSIGNVGSDKLSLGLDTSLNIESTNVKIASFLGLYRLDADQIEFKHIGSGVSEANIPLLEIKP